MRKSIGSILCLMAIGCVVTAAGAQDIASDMDFRGVSAIRVTGSPMSVESIDCNIDQNALIRQLQRQFEGDGLPAAAGSDMLAVITVLSAREADGPCNSAVMLGAYKKASFFDEDAKWLRTGYVVVWQSGLLFASRADTHTALAGESLARLGQAMLTEWRHDNAAAPMPGQ